MADFKFIRYQTDQTITLATGNADCRVKPTISLVFDSDGASGKYGIVQTVQPPNINIQYIQVFLKYNKNYSPAVGGEATLDGIELKAGDKVWLSNQTNSSENGIYLVTTSAWTYLQPVTHEVFVDLGARAFDKLNGDLTRTILTEHDINFTKVGFYTIKYYVVNTMGVLSSVSRKVKIINVNASIIPTTTFNITDLQIKTEYDKNTFNVLPPRGSVNDCDACGATGPFITGPGLYIRRDGLVTFNQNQSMGNKNLTGVGTATHALDAINLSQMQSLLTTSANLARIAGSYTAGQNIAQFQVVYINSNGMIYPANTSDISQMNRVVGVAMNNGGVGTGITVAIAGTITGLSSLVSGSYYFFDTIGNLTTSVPTIGFRQIIGIAISSTSMLVNIRVPVGI